MMFCSFCKKDVQLPVKGCANGEFCIFAVINNAQIYADEPLNKVWTAVEEFADKNTQWTSLQQWKKDPQNGPLFLQCQEEAEKGVKQSNIEKRSSEFLSIIKGAKLSYSRVGFGHGYWSFGFDKGQLDTAVESLRELVLTACDALKTPDPNTMELFKAYFGNDDQYNCEFLEQQFTELKGITVTGIVSKKTIIICKGGDTEGTRAFGYVRPTATENVFLGDTLNRFFRCIFLTNACLTGNDSDIKVDQKWFRATTLLHELTHLLEQKTEDRKTANGNYAYGRVLCGKLKRENIDVPSMKNDPSSNAESYAYFACDLKLIKESVITKQKVFDLVNL